MLDNFFETIGEELAKRLLDYLFGPAFLFWAGGMGLYIWQNGWEVVDLKWQALAIYQQATAVLVALLIVSISSLAMQSIQLQFIQLLEGYWPWPLNYLAIYFVSMKKNHFREKYKELRKLKQKQKTGEATSEEEYKLTELEDWAHINPVSEKDLLLTRLGNLLRAREMASSRKYGLDALVCLPRLWGLLPEDLRGNLTSSRDVLNQQAELCFWGLLFVVWTVLNPLAVLISLIWMFSAYHLALQTAGVYGDLLETAFDLYRFELYDALGWPRPKDSEEEQAKGEQVSEFLWRGSTGGKIDYSILAKGG